MNDRLMEALSSAIYVSKMYLAGTAVTEADQRIRASGLYPDWLAGNHVVGDVCNANGQTWECYQAHDNATYPDIKPDNAAWYTFWRPLHGKPRKRLDLLSLFKAHTIFIGPGSS